MFDPASISDHAPQPEKAIEKRNEENFLAKYDESFQADVLGMLVHRHSFLKTNAPYLKTDFFANEIHRIFAGVVLDLHKAFPDEPVTWTAIINEFGKKKAGLGIKTEDEHLYLEVLSQIKLPPANPAYIEREIQQFTSLKRMEDALTEAAYKHLPKRDYLKILELVNNAATSKNGLSVIEPARIVASSSDFFKRLKDPAELATKTGIPTGFQELDKCLFSGGVDRGEMIVVCGPPGRGKSPWLINCTARITQSGMPVLYYTLEVSRGIVEQRYHSCLTGIPMVDLRMRAEEAEKRWNTLNSHFRFGELILYDLPSRKLKPSTIRSHLIRHKDEGIEIQAVVVDYADIMASDKPTSLDNRRLEYGDIYEELRAIAKEFNVAMFTASAGNRGSLNKKEVDLDDMAEDFSKAFTADYAIGLSQTKADQQARPEREPHFGTGRIRLFIAKNRNQKRGDTIECWSDFARMRVSAADWNEFDNRHFGERLLNLTWRPRP